METMVWVGRDAKAHLTSTPLEQAPLQGETEAQSQASTNSHMRKPCQGRPSQSLPHTLLCDRAAAEKL